MKPWTVIGLGGVGSNINPRVAAEEKRNVRRFMAEYYQKEVQVSKWI